MTTINQHGDCARFSFQSFDIPALLQFVYLVTATAQSLSRFNGLVTKSKEFVGFQQDGGIGEQASQDLIDDRRIL